MFAQTRPGNASQKPFIILSSVDSSNNYAMAKLHASILDHGSALLAWKQTAGKGQRGKSWKAAPGENITMSTVFSLPHAFSADNLTKIQSFPFLFSAAVALGCYDFIKGCGAHDIKIKWPNDLYIGDRKAGGILIENIIRAGDWKWAICGTGINMNQVLFDDLSERAVSLKQVTDKVFDIVMAARQLQQCLLDRISWLEEAGFTAVLYEYNTHLYKRDEQIKLKKESAVFNTTVRQVAVDGKLHTSDVIDRIFSVGEVEFV